MTAMLENPEILQLVNKLILNIVSIIETFGILALQMSLIFFAIYIMYYLWRGIRDVTRPN